MIHSVAKAIEVLGTFSAENPRLSLAEIARRRALPKSTTHNILATLVAYRLVEKLEDDTYALGTGLISLTQGVRVNVELRDRAAPLLRQLADDTRESVYLTVLDAGQSLYIYAVESPRRLLARSVVGERVPLHCTGVGKATLANKKKDSFAGFRSGKDHQVSEESFKILKTWRAAEIRRVDDENRSVAGLCPLHEFGPMETHIVLCGLPRF